MPTYLQPLYEESSTRSMTANFLGLNRNLRIGDGEFFDMKNLTSDDFPVMAVRPRRRYDYKDFNLNAIFRYSDTQNAETRDIAAIADATLFLPNKTPTFYDLTPYGFDKEAKVRSVVRMGAYLIIVPDMIYVNTVSDPVEIGRIEDRYTDTESRFTVSVTDYNGEPATFTQQSKPKGTEEEPLLNGDTWHKTGDNPKLYRYDEERGEWYEIGSYLRISAAAYREAIPAWQSIHIAMRSAIQPGDALRISGIGDAVDGARMVVKSSVTTYDEKAVLEFFLEGIIGEAVLETTATAESPVIIERAIPSMDYVCEAGNRLWGCRYGGNGHGEFVNEIYCSARGDFFRWIAGSADNEDAPVTFSVGADGVWTGAVNYQGYPTFFKEHGMHRVSGSGASGFALYDTPCVGVDIGAHKSLAVVNNVLYYKGEAAIMAFDGSTPVAVSEKLGRLSAYRGACGGAQGGKYYVSLWKKNGDVPTDPVLYALDTVKGLWHKEDESEVADMVSVRDSLYMMTVQRKNGEYLTSRVEVVGSTGGASMEPAGIPWFAETGIIGLETPDAKYVSKLAIRLHMDTGSSVRVLVQYNSSGYWKQIGATNAPTMKTVTMPVMPARCDHMRLRLEGVGGCKVYSITKTLESAEEV